MISSRPVTFTDELAPHRTTNAHELALSVIFESGLLHLADSVEAYQNLPDEPKAFLRGIPVVWDETHDLAGEPGQFIVLARRNGNDWYIGGINSQANPQPVTLDFSFLNGAGSTMTLIQDGDNRLSSHTATSEVNGSAPVSLTMQSDGGFVAHLTPSQ